MASKQHQGQDLSMVRPPEGFRRAASVANAGWFYMNEVGNTIQGTLEGMYQRKDALKGPDGESDFFQIRVTAPCKVRVGRQDSVELVMAKPGDYVNLNYGPKTKPLEKEFSKVTQGAVVEIWGTVISEKVKLSGGRNMHNFDLFIKPIRPPEASEDSDPDLEDGFDETVT